MPVNSCFINKPFDRVRLGIIDHGHFVAMSNTRRVNFFGPVTLTEARHFNGKVTLTGHGLMSLFRPDQSVYCNISVINDNMNGESKDRTSNFRSEAFIVNETQATCTLPLTLKSRRYRVNLITLDGAVLYLNTNSVEFPLNRALEIKSLTWEIWLRRNMSSIRLYKVSDTSGGSSNPPIGMTITEPSRVVFKMQIESFYGEVSCQLLR
jgi:hypothetical protein